MSAPEPEKKDGAISLVLFIVSVFVLPFWYGKSLATVWSWLLVPILGVRPIGLAEAIGLMCFVSIFLVFRVTPGAIKANSGTSQGEVAIAHFTKFLFVGMVVAEAAVIRRFL